jgi:hypothetical protein
VLLKESKSGTDGQAPPLTASLSEQAPVPWQSLVARVGAGVHLSPAWIRYRTALGTPPRYVLLQSSAGTPLAAGVVYLRKPRFRPWVRPSGFADRAPWGEPSAGLDPTAIGAAMADLARQQRWSELVLDSFDGPIPAGDLQASGFSVTERWEFLVDLLPNEEERMAVLKGSLRRKIRKAIKAGVEVRTESGLEAVRRLQALQGHTQERRRQRGEAMSCPGDEQYRILSREFVDQGGGRLVVGVLHGQPVTSILLGEHQQRAYYLMGGSNAEGLAANSASLVMWRATQMLHEEGFQVLNLGGVPHAAEAAGHPEHGLYRFKSSFADPVLCRSGRLSKAQ